MTRLVFGSAEAAAILAKDRELRRLERAEQPTGDANELADRLERIEADIDMVEMELAGLEDERDAIKEQMARMERPQPKIGALTLKQWNAWATGGKPQQEQPTS